MVISIDGDEVTGITIDGEDVTEVTVDGDVVWQASVGYYLDMSSSGSNVDLSSHSVSISPGMSFLTWVQVEEVGLNGSQYPGIFATADSGGWDNFYTLYDDDGTGGATTGTVNVSMGGEDSSGNYLRSDTFTVDLDNPSWHLLGFTYHSDGTITFWSDGSSLPVTDALGSSASFDINYIGFGYAGAENDGSGGKLLDSPAVWDKELTSAEVNDYYNNGTLPSNPLHHWPFNDNSDTSTVLDAVGSANGTINGSPYVEGGPGGGGGGGGDGGGSEDPDPPDSTNYYLDMTSSGANIDLSNNSIAITPGMTFLTWVRVESVGYGGAHYPGIFSGSSGGSWSNFFTFYDGDSTGGTDTGQVTMYMGGDTSSGDYSRTSTFTLDLDNPSWHLLGLTYNSDNSVTYWLDGSAISTTSDVEEADQYDVAYIGHGYAGVDDGGAGGKSMDSPAIWNRELTSSEVSDYYNNGTLPSSPQHHWPLDETANDAAGSADGTVNSSTYVEGDVP